MRSRVGLVMVVCAALAGSITSAGRARAEDAGRSTTRDEALATLRAERERQIERLRQYVAARAFPAGGVEPMAPDDPHHAEGRTHTFIGQNGALCAVAHLIAASGRRPLVERIAREENGLCVGVSGDREVAAWILSSGLTREECVRIQEPGFEDELREPLRMDVPDTETDPLERLEAARKSAIAAHLERVLARLEEDTEASLQVAVARLLARN